MSLAYMKELLDTGSHAILHLFHMSQYHQVIKTLLVLGPINHHLWLNLVLVYIIKIYIIKQYLEIHIDKTALLSILFWYDCDFSSFSDVLCVTICVTAAPSHGLEHHYTLLSSLFKRYDYTQERKPKRIVKRSILLQHIVIFY